MAPKRVTTKSSCISASLTADRLDRSAGSSAEPIRGELIGANIAVALGTKVRAYAPALALSRALVNLGIDPSRPLELYRGSTLCLKIRSIGEAAELEINGKGTGFIRRSKVAGASPVAKNETDASFSSEDGQ